MTKIAEQDRVMLRRIVGPLPGGTRSLLVEDQAGRLFTLKSPHNPQGPNVLANEWFASQLLPMLNLPTRKAQAINVPEGFVANDCKGFMGLLCDFLEPAQWNRCFEVLPIRLAKRVRNRDSLLGMLVFDSWTGSTDRRQALYIEDSGGDIETVYFDHGHLFGGPSWAFDGIEGDALSLDKALYGMALAEESVAHWISEIRTKLLHMLPSVLEFAPKAWYHGSLSDLQAILLDRAGRLEDIIDRELSIVHSRIANQGGYLSSRDQQCHLGVEAFVPRRTRRPALPRDLA